jgi:hypothetical protein
MKRLHIGLLMTFSTALSVACGGETVADDAQGNGVGEGSGGSATGAVGGNGGSPGSGGTEPAGATSGGGAMGAVGGASAADAGSDGASDPCASAMVGSACESEGAACGGPCIDPCSFCNITTCQLGTWQRMEAFPAPCFACGNLRCIAGTTYCVVSPSDQDDVPSEYSCEPMPTACTDEPTCACVSEQVTVDDCTQGETGLPEITVVIEPWG